MVKERGKDTLGRQAEGWRWDWGKGRSYQSCWGHQEQSGGIHETWLLIGGGARCGAWAVVDEDGIPGDREVNCQLLF